MKKIILTLVVTFAGTLVSAAAPRPYLIQGPQIIVINHTTTVDDIRNRITQLGQMCLIQYPGLAQNYLAPDARDIIRRDSVARGRGLSEIQIEVEARQFLIHLARNLSLASFGAIQVQINP